MNRMANHPSRRRRRRQKDTPFTLNIVQIIRCIQRPVDDGWMVRVGWWWFGVIITLMAMRRRWRCWRTHCVVGGTHTHSFGLRASRRMECVRVRVCACWMEWQPSADCSRTKFATPSTTWQLEFSLNRAHWQTCAYIQASLPTHTHTQTHIRKFFTGYVHTHEIIQPKHWHFDCLQTRPSDKTAKSARTFQRTSFFESVLSWQQDRVVCHDSDRHIHVVKWHRNVNGKSNLVVVRVRYIRMDVGRLAAHRRRGPQTRNVTREITNSTLRTQMGRFDTVGRTQCGRLKVRAMTDVPTWRRNDRFFRGGRRFARKRERAATLFVFVWAFGWGWLGEMTMMKTSSNENSSLCVKIIHSSTHMIIFEELLKKKKLAVYHCISAFLSACFFSETSHIHILNGVISILLGYDKTTFISCSFHFILFHSCLIVHTASV